MQLRINTFTKILGLIVLLLIPIIMLYWFSNRTTVEVVTDQIENSMYKDLSFFAAKLDENVTQISKNGLLISEDMNVRALEFLETANLYEQTNEKMRIEEKLRLLNASTPLDPMISIYAPDTQTFLTTNPNADYDEASAALNFTREWKFTTRESPFFAGQPRFVRYMTYPYDTPLEHAGLIVELSFPAAELTKALDGFKAGGKGDPFLVSPDRHSIQSTDSNAPMISDLLASLDLKALSEKHYTRIPLAGKEYAISCSLLPKLGWYLVDYVPIHEIIHPITTNSYLFYASILFLLLVSIPAAYYLYTNVQVPIRELIRGVQKLKMGVYPRLNVFHRNNEFHFLLVRFNEMAEQIEQLIQNVYVEQIRSRDANLKQLQSQINPHFLYNCFSLIRSLTRLGEKESVMQLALHLSKYYRYTTRSDKQIATLGEELELVHSYLAIQAIHVQGMTYSIDIPETMLNLEIPRLILQPIIENAVLHGIEAVGEGWVRIDGGQGESFNSVTVSDNGRGLNREQLERIQTQLAMPVSGEEIFALWNTRQRMLLQYGAEAGLRISLREEGGLTVELYWPRDTGAAGA